VATPPARLIAVVGPTAAGKSALALELAAAHGGEIVCCDSLHVCRGFDIGSAKPTPEDRRRVPHHLVDVADPREVFSAADYARIARVAIRGISARGRLPFVVGGSGLYFRALFRGLFAGPARDERLRARFEGIAERHGDARLHRLLRRVDPTAAARIEPADRVRVVRALEVYWRSGRPISAHHAAAPAEPLAGFACFVAGLAPDRAALRRAVEERSRAMLAAGLLDEVRALVERHPGARALGAIGYREAAAALRGELTVEAARHAMVAATMRYAKRQLTWFRKEPSVRWFDGAEAARLALREWLAAEPAEDVR
jgi:tRNA dimethylallyltransferase